MLLRVLHAKPSGTALSISIAGLSEATWAYAAHVARDRFNATAAPPVPAPAIAARAGSALILGLYRPGLSRRDSSEQPSPQDSRADQLQRLAPRDGAASEPPRQLVEGILIRHLFPGRTDLLVLVSLP